MPRLRQRSIASMLPGLRLHRNIGAITLCDTAYAGIARLLAPHCNCPASRAGVHLLRGIGRVVMLRRLIGLCRRRG